MSRRFIPQDFDVPATLETSEFRRRALTVDDVVRDFGRGVGGRGVAIRNRDGWLRQRSQRASTLLAAASR